MDAAPVHRGGFKCMQMEATTLSLSHKDLLRADRDPIQAAEVAHLLYVSDTHPGINRLNVLVGELPFPQRRAVVVFVIADVGQAGVEQGEDVRRHLVSRQTLDVALASLIQVRSGGPGYWGPWGTIAGHWRRERVGHQVAADDGGAGTSSEGGTA